MHLNRLITTLALSAAAMAAQASTVLVGSGLLVNGDFEVSNVAGNAYKYVNYVTTTQVSANAWTFAGGSGIANRSAAWGGVATGSAVAFLQSFPGFEASTLTQTFTALYSSLDITFSLAQRPTNQESLRVVFDGVDLTPTLLTPAGSSWNTYTLTASNLNSRSHTLTFVGVNNSSISDSTLFIDNVSVNPSATVPEPGSLALVGAAFLGAGFVRRRLNGYAS
jgi:hypothetical protein